MKTTILISSFAIALSMISCKKEKPKTEVSYSYKAEDGSRAKATFIEEGKDKTVTLESNHNTFVLDFKKKTAEGEYYERSTISAETKGDSLLISQDDQVIHLVKDK